MDLVFAYGTLKDPQVRKKIIGRDVQTKEDIIDGYTTTKIKIDDQFYPILVPDPTTCVVGRVFSVDQKELDAIDEYESKKYTRKKIGLKSGKTAWVYGKFSKVL